MRRVIPLAALLIASCGDIHTGGFETSDLQARVQRQDGSPVASARVWLVRSQGEAGPAIVLDSAQTDGSGMAAFKVLAEMGRDGLGVDAQDGDLLGASPLALEHTPSALVQLRAPRSLKVEQGPDGKRAYLHVAGSHFSSNSSADGTASVLVFPEGIWNVTLRTPTGSTITLPAVVLLRDSVLSSLSSTDTAHPSPLPDIERDTFVFEGVRQVVDTGALAISAWEMPTESNGSWGYRPDKIWRDSSGTLLESAPIRAFDGTDSFPGQLGAQAISPELPPSGTIALRFSSNLPPSLTSHAVLTMSLLDSNGNGLKAIASPAMDSAAFFCIGNFQPVLGLANLRREISSQVIWYFSWTPSSITVSSSTRILGKASRPNSVTPLRFHIQLQSDEIGQIARSRLEQIRIYQPL